MEFPNISPTLSVRSFPMRTPHASRVCSLLYLLLALIPPIYAESSHDTSQWIADYALDMVIAATPYPFGIPHKPTSTPSPPSARLRAREASASTPKTKNLLIPRVDPLRIEVPIPRDPARRFITVFLYTASQLLVPYQIESCLVAANNVIQNVLNDPTINGNPVIPAEAYPLTFAPHQAMRAYVEIDEGQHRGMTFRTLQLAIQGVWNLLVVGGRSVEATFEIW
ncbi:MAG: hypothetical protein Q9201_004798 [Fulgogasparrea decipioides]